MPDGGYPPLIKFTCSSVLSVAESVGAKGRGFSVSDGGKYSRRVPCRTAKWNKYKVSVLNFYLKIKINVLLYPSESSVRKRI